MEDLNSALDSAFEGERASSGASEPSAPVAAPEPEPAAAPAEEKPEASPEISEETFHNPTAEELAAIEANPALKKAYESFRRGFNKKTAELAEIRKRTEFESSQQKQLWDALNNPQTQRQAVEALARTVGLQIQSTDQPQRQQAAQVADGIESEWAQVVGPEAAQLLRPLIEKTALAAVNGTLQPLQKATEYLQMDARSRQAEAQVSQFKSVAAKKGWNLTPEVEARMAEYGQQVLPARPIETVDDGIKHLERLYRLATADTAESDMEKRIFERMQKAAQSAEPTRGVPSTGREKRSNITKEMSLSEAMDVAMQEAVEGR